MVEPLFPDLVADGTVLEMFSEFNILGVILDSKLAFEKQVRAIAAFASRRVDILRKKMSVLSRCRCCCQMLLGIHVSCARVLFSSLCVFFKIDSLVDHPVRGLIPAQYLLRRLTHGAFAAHSRSFEMPRSRTVQALRSFVLSCVRLWNGLHKSIFAGEGVDTFKTSVNRFLLQG